MLLFELGSAEEFYQRFDAFFDAEEVRSGILEDQALVFVSDTRARLRLHFSFKWQNLSPLRDQK